MFCQQSADFYSLSHLYVEVNASHSTARLVRYNVIAFYEIVIVSIRKTKQ
jgi:hypothetical protein